MGRIRIRSTALYFTNEVMAKIYGIGPDAESPHPVELPAVGRLVQYGSVLHIPIQVSTVYVMEMEPRTGRAQSRVLVQQSVITLRLGNGKCFDQRCDYHAANIASA